MENGFGIVLLKKTSSVSEQGRLMALWAAVQPPTVRDCILFLNVPFIYLTHVLQASVRRIQTKPFDARIWIRPMVDSTRRLCACCVDSGTVTSLVSLCRRTRSLSCHFLLAWNQTGFQPFGGHAWLNRVSYLERLYCWMCMSWILGQVYQAPL